MNIQSHHSLNAALLHALAHPIRVCIVEGLVQAERDVSTIVHCLEQPQPKISQHLNVLKAAGIIEGRREGTRIVYRIKDPRARALITTLSACPP
jgi:ArsR family transcriptional regulator